MNVVERVRSVIGPGPAGLHEPDFGPRERESVNWCLDSGWVSYAGEMVQEFEKRLAQRCQRKHCIATSSGTAALHLAYLWARAGEIPVFVPAIGFVATANAVVHAGGRPTFVAAHVPTVHPEPDYATVGVDLFGFPCGVDYEVLDASQSLGSTYDGKPAADFGLVSVLSFNGNKIVTTGGGGAVLTDEDDAAEFIRHLASTARVVSKDGPWLMEHDQVAFNYRMPALNAALGIAQLERLDEFLTKKRNLHEAYLKAFDSFAGGAIIEDGPDQKSNHWLNVLLLNNPKDRDPILSSLHRAGYQARACWTPLHLLPMFKKCPRSGDLSADEDFASRVICLPSSPKLWRG